MGGEKQKIIRVEKGESLDSLDINCGDWIGITERDEKITPIPMLIMNVGKAGMRRIENRTARMPRDTLLLRYQPKGSKEEFWHVDVKREYFLKLCGPENKMGLRTPRIETISADYQVIKPFTIYSGAEALVEGLRENSLSFYEDWLVSEITQNEKLNELKRR